MGMDNFVNYQKRGIQLPPGCKDLIDILKARQETRGTDKSIGHWEPAPKPETVAEGGILQVERHLGRMLQSAAKVRSLLILSDDGQIAVALFHQAGVFKVVTFVDVADASQETAVRSLFSQAGIQPIQDYVMSNAEKPVRAVTFPLPPIAPEAAGLIVALLRSYGLTDEAGLDFMYHEKDAT